MRIDGIDDVAVYAGCSCFIYVDVDGEDVGGQVEMGVFLGRGDGLI